MNELYLDASALTKLVIDEPGSSDLERLVQHRSLVTSRVAVVEVAKAIGRVSTNADARAVFDLVSIVEFDDEIASLASAAGGPTLRALDAIHVATAIRLGPELESFVTYDERQGAAARAAGLQVLSPGIDPDPDTIADLLEAIPGAYERAQQGLADVRAGRVVSLDDL